MAIRGNSMTCWLIRSAGEQKAAVTLKVNLSPSMRALYLSMGHARLKIRHALKCSHRISIWKVKDISDESNPSRYRPASGVAFIWDIFNSSTYWFNVCTSKQQCRIFSRERPYHQSSVISNIGWFQSLIVECFSINEMKDQMINIIRYALRDIK